MIDQLSKYYSCRILTEKDIPSILSLYESNPLYFQHCPPEPNFAFVGFWNGSDLVAVMDFVYAYPDEETVFIGLFMVDQAYQRKGIGSHIVTEALAYFAKNFRKARLAYVKGNPQSQHFWEKQGFKSIGCEVKQELYTVVIAEQSLED
ncbi:GNAT family acetyltransferase [Streptococcus pneumoniae]|uniref:GNAT family N-acetyltransferase n=1 Tax=Streptococcus pneumoniae TaxID=1313 RepID=UPI0005E8F631|nr:GNAT family N-acetyltransferase [Streptococcus pneumoniae]MDG7948340.1 GNAT family N-acetyltransferase [Streptococcus pneumoniae]MDG8114351.1 GNAT family N-acetyltransferase [Streptococcus pneumoniae]MDG8169880.1 GNAT family N-acetyltransferase [Streptococcus pneumoniae]CIO11827.1 GNAT family acetyltransferase [Streptococcus pneumoniae]CIO78427.1 GNAT family acetyltransferase [Streptococcus pneumoniae]